LSVILCGLYGHRLHAGILSLVGTSQCWQNVWDHRIHFIFFSVYQKMYLGPLWQVSHTEPFENRNAWDTIRIYLSIDALHFEEFRFFNWLVWNVLWNCHARSWFDFQNFFLYFPVLNSYDNIVAYKFLDLSAEHVKRNCPLVLLLGYKLNFI
jgi:hypothetical protein